MEKHILLYGGILIIALSFLGLYDLLSPRVGPIGNGPPTTFIWFIFSMPILIGLALTATSIVKFRNEKNTKNY